MAYTYIYIIITKGNGSDYISSLKNLSVGFGRGSRVEGRGSRESLSFRRGSHVEGRESKVEDRGSYLLLNDDFFSEDFFPCRSVQFGRHVPPRFDLMSLNMIALHIINVFATAE